MGVPMSAPPGAEAQEEFTGAAANDEYESEQGDRQKPKCDVESIIDGGTDGRGSRVKQVYFKTKTYAIYATDDDLISVAYSDNDDEATKQIHCMASILPLRNRLQYLSQHVTDRNHCYLPQIAEALRLGLEAESKIGEKLLLDAIDDANAILLRKARFHYILWALTSCVVVIFLAIIALAIAWKIYSINLEANAKGLPLVIIGGALGSLLSITMAVRSRSVLLEGDRLANWNEVIMRVLIGVISAAVLYMVIASSAVPQLKLGGFDLMDLSKPFTCLLVGFFAGFVERLVPDLFDRKSSEPMTATPKA
jgi:hypothetical protein